MPPSIRICTPSAKACGASTRIASIRSRVCKAHASKAASAISARPESRVRPTSRAASATILQRARRAGERWDQHHALLLAGLGASALAPCGPPPIRRPCSIHWIAAPAMKIAPSSA